MSTTRVIRGVLRRGGVVLGRVEGRGMCFASNGNPPPPRTSVQPHRQGSGSKGQPALDMWVAVKDNQSGGIYWWNKDNNETTEVGAPKPVTFSIRDPWVEVKDEKSGMIYYWNQLTDETTALGEPKPSPHAQPRMSMGFHGGSTMESLKQAMIWGFGVSIAFGLMSRLMF
ncbi:hypothetical protein AAMO2058_001016700 [Amorphochlora amoebiformis]